MFYPTDVAQEVAAEGMRPDIVARRGERVLFIEVAVWHKVGRDKLALIEAKRQATIEIDLSGRRHEVDAGVLERLILYDAPREWLFNAAKHDREEPVRLAAAAAREARDEAGARRVLADLDRPQIAVAPADTYLGGLIQGVERAGFAPAIGVPVRGDGVFFVRPRIWQALVLSRILLSGKKAVALQDFSLDREPSVVVRPVIMALKTEGDMNWSLIEQRTGGRVRPPQMVLQDYLQALVERGIAVWQSDDSISCAPEIAERIRTLVQKASDVTAAPPPRTPSPPRFQGGPRRGRL